MVMLQAELVDDLVLVSRLPQHLLGDQMRIGGIPVADHGNAPRYVRIDAQSHRAPGFDNHLAPRVPTELAQLDLRDLPRRRRVRAEQLADRRANASEDELERHASVAKVLKQRGKLRPLLQGAIVSNSSITTIGESEWTAAISVSRSTPSLTVLSWLVTSRTLSS